jgi:hypothetical protein
VDVEYSNNHNHHIPILPQPKMKAEMGVEEPKGIYEGGIWGLVLVTDASSVYPWSLSCEEYLTWSPDHDDAKACSLPESKA